MRKLQRKIKSLLLGYCSKQKYNRYADCYEDDEESYVELRCTLAYEITLDVAEGITFEFRCSPKVQALIDSTDNGKWVACVFSGVCHAGIKISYPNGSFENVLVQSVVKPSTTIRDEDFVDALYQVRRRKRTPKTIKLPNGSKKTIEVLPQIESEKRFDDAPYRQETTSAVRIITKARKNNWRDSENVKSDGFTSRDIEF